MTRLGAVRNVARRWLYSLRTDVQRLASSGVGFIPPLLDNAVTAWYYQQGGKSAAFPCELESCITSNGLGFSSTSWHPFVATLREYLQGSCYSFDCSSLHRYYAVWRPVDAAEALICFAPGEGPLAGLASHLFSFCPWRATTIEEYGQEVREWWARDNRAHGRLGSDLEAYGFKAHGPVAPEFGRMEHGRLVAVAESIRNKGYDRTGGDTFVVMLRRGSEYRFLQRGGIHRTAAMSALGYESVPARLQGIVDVTDVDYWPKVRDGFWDREAALRYANHLFDFDSRQWAKEKGLL